MAAGVFDVAAERPDGDDYDFFARATGHFILSRATFPALRLVRSSETILRGGGDGFALRAQLSGVISGIVGDKAIECSAGGVIFIDLLQTLDLRVIGDAEGATDVTLWIPRTRILSSTNHESALHGFVLPEASPAAAVICACLRVLAQIARKMTTKEMDALIDGVVELAAKSIAPLLDRIGGPDGRKPLASFVTIRRHVDQNLRSPTLDADQLARTFGLSRASLYRLFEPVGGVASYIRNARLNRAYQEIVASEFSNRRIGPVAYRLGFKNLSAFTRLFKETYGVSPSEARERARHGFDFPPPEINVDRASSLDYWLRRMGAGSARNDRAEGRA